MRYPRAVSPISYEPVVPTASDVVYESDDSLDEDTEERQAKRRRIEEIGTRYLQGHPIVLLTAKLRGPFEGRHKNKHVKWENPWTKANKNNVDASESGQKVIPESAWREGQRSDLQATSRSRSDGNKSFPGNATKARRHIPKTNTTKKTPWLRKDRDISTEDEDIQRSPTPVRRNINRLQTIYPSIMVPEESKIMPQATSEIRNENTHASNDQFLLKDKSNDKSPEPRSTSDTVELNLDEEDYRSALEEQSIRFHQHKQPSPHTEHWQQPPIKEEPEKLPKQMSRTRKARYMDFASPVTVTAPKTTTVQPSLERRQSEQQAVGGIEDHPSKGEEMPSIVHPNPEQSPRENHEMEAPNEGIQAADSNSGHRMLDSAPADDGNASARGTDAVPSAQIDPQPVLQLQPPSTASIASIPQENMPANDNTAPEAEDAGHNTMVEDSLLLLSTQAAVSKAQQKLKNDLFTFEKPEIPKRPTERPSEAVDQTSKDGIRLFRAMNTPSPPRTRQLRQSLIAGNADTQEMLDAMTPFVLTTVKKKPAKPTNYETPSTAIKSKGQKRASFAPTSQESVSSSGSIKSALKVTKPSTHIVPAKELGDLENTDPNFISRDDLEENDHDSLRSSEDLPSLGKLLNNSSRHALQNKSQPAGFPVSSTGLFNISNSNPTSKVHDEAQVDGRIPIGNDTGAEFDLAAAMDDMGSFLQSWDPEKEMKALSKTSTSNGRQTNGTSTRI